MAGLICESYRGSFTIVLGPSQWLWPSSLGWGCGGVGQRPAATGATVNVCVTPPRGTMRYERDPGRCLRSEQPLTLMMPQDKQPGSTAICSGADRSYQQESINSLEGTPPEHRRPRWVNVT